jgi:hypothetical protein
VTLTEAANAWLEAKAEIKAAEARLKPAAEQLKAHFRKTGKPSFRRVGYAVSTYTTIDTDAVRAELADRIDDFLLVRERETLSVLGA